MGKIKIDALLKWFSDHASKIVAQQTNLTDPANKDVNRATVIASLKENTKVYMIPKATAIIATPKQPDAHCESVFTAYEWWFTSKNSSCEGGVVTIFLNDPNYTSIQCLQKRVIVK